MIRSKKNDQGKRHNQGKRVKKQKAEEGSEDKSSDEDYEDYYDLERPYVWHSNHLEQEVMQNDRNTTRDGHAPRRKSVAVNTERAAASATPHET